MKKLKKTFSNYFNSLINFSYVPLMNEEYVMLRLYVTLNTMKTETNINQQFSVYLLLKCFNKRLLKQT